MKSVKIKLSLIIALAFLIIAALGSFFGLTFAKADRTVSITGSSIFITNQDAEVWADHIVDGEATEDYTQFVLTKNGDTVNFRQNLAYRWVTNGNSYLNYELDGEQKPEIGFDKQDGWFNMEIGFKKPNDDGFGFEKYIITFESQQFVQTKDGKTTNYLVFTPAEDDKLTVSVAHKTDDDEDMDEAIARTEEVGKVNSDKIKIEFTGVNDGDYTIAISNDGETPLTTLFTNIGKTYAKRSSSTVTPVTPMSFAAKFATEEVDGVTTEVAGHGNALMTLFNLNGQSFKLTGAREVTDDGGQHYTGGTVNDSAPPVLCLDKGLPFIKYNGEISFDYTVIDVLTTSPSLTTSYFMLTGSDAEKGAEFKPEEGYAEEGGLYRKVTDSDDQYMIPHTEHYLPVAENFATENNPYDDTFDVKAAVKVVLKLTDTTTSSETSSGQSTYVLLDWFVEDNYLLNIGGTKYIAVTEDKQGVSYAYTKNGASDPDDAMNADWKKIKEDYQKAVTEAAKDLKAGSKNYFYLPSVKSLLGDNATAYEDLTFSIYYNNGSKQQNSNKKSNELSINVNKPGKYIFTVYATDAASNDMYYYDGDEKKEFTTSNIWNMFDEKKDTEWEGTKKYLPWFEFDVDVSEISIDDPEEQSTAYVGSSYTPDSFTINGVAYDTKYSLYQFENNLYANDNGGVAMTYEYFIANKDTLLKDYRKYFTKIKATSDLKEGTEAYDKFNDYGWNGTSLSFTPQSDNAFYLIECTASSSDDGQTATAYMGIAAAPKVETLKGEDTWVQDNITSIILLCIAGAALVGIILLIAIKPKNKGDVDEAVFEARPKRTSKKK